MIRRELEAHELALTLLFVYGAVATTTIDRLLREVFGVDSLDRIDAPQALDEYKLAIEIDNKLILTQKGEMQARKLLEEHQDLQVELACHRLLPTKSPDVHLGMF